MNYNEGAAGVTFAEIPEEASEQVIKEGRGRAGEVRSEPVRGSGITSAVIEPLLVSKYVS
jgi:hypothetical protein